MPDDSKSDAVEKFLSEQQSLEDRKQSLVEDLLKQREAALKEFDEKLAKLGYHANSGKTRRSHHRKAATPSDAAPRPVGKTKA